MLKYLLNALMVYCLHVVIMDKALVKVPLYSRHGVNDNSNSGKVAVA